MLSLGPFSIRVIAVAVAALLAWLVARFIQRKPPNDQPKTASSLILDVLLLGLIAARASYVVQWWRDYASAPRSIIAFGDGGFDWRIGIVAALMFAAWRLRRLPALRKPVAAGIVAGLAAWGIAQGTLATLQRNALPFTAMQLETLDATPVLPQRFAGKPVVVNLWATWCAPCRREMPILEQAQRDRPDLAVLMLNQGENAQTVRAFLERQGLQFDNVLLDPSLRAMHAYGSRGLPTTLFFNAKGELVESHMGELSAARLRDTLGELVRR
ncbi:TlpA family protein disulfide reductase [Burkholderia sp. AU19243]|uniref:TlpA family protein disulfide reductase n=1 Tax=Burkholderia TaxID=32008 RepID=UPI001AE68EE3|nr:MULTISPECIES: TlpA disulfide reductase family protein [Burkholderia]MBR7959634.1 TlpA family protein disulfide reductase [Burkholderia vietnamiensis]MBR8144285.1 TlpA family protein disulfide reductase [Burkholderia vietnamiensis]MBR8366123.1 TlpA family protein disulfide reductase [Burkholderia sp. AU19243]MBY4695114.1 TlpA family protein disulfide reductase [Burkholderia latens]QTO45637.1 TlpA family protein disulfide reductase [Burkholderia latens]